jgi:hypothetical protein
MKNTVLLVSILLISGAIYGQDYHQIVEDHLVKNHAHAFKKAALLDFVVQQEDFSRSMKATVVKIQQTVNGVPIYNGVATALVKGEKVHHFSDNLEKNYNRISPKTGTMSPEVALTALFRRKNLQNHENYRIAGFSDPDDDHLPTAKQRLVYFRKDGDLLLCYEYHFHDSNSSNYWDILVDAVSGEIVHEQNLTLACSFNHEGLESQKTAVSTPAKIGKAGLYAPDNASYNVFALPVESPSFGPRSLVSNPWFHDASPEGWHSDGSTHYTITRGNNVYAYEDLDANNGAGFSPDGGPARIFDFPYTPGTPAQTNLSAAITNLFYIGNKTHDIFYRLGFTESARNFQTNNFGKGGLGNDEVLAEAQDSSELNNSNFFTPPDGTRPRMQMFLWSPPFVQRVFYNSPLSAVSRQPNSRPAEFGPALTPTGITADVIISPVLDACVPMAAGFFAGKIGLAERGNCNFTVKVKNMQDAGAVGALIYNATTSANFISMGGTDPSVTIPSVLIENAEGEFIKTTINSGTNVNVTLKHDPTLDANADGSFDNGIIVHEYGHGISTRLTGNGYSCLNRDVSKEQMGEGWSDFFTLMLTNQPNATAAVPRSVGTFAAGQDAAGMGIRPAKYSPDFTVNNYTYGKTNGMEFMEDGVMTPHVHSIGFVWATILWDLHWRYAEKYGYASDVMSNATNGSTRVLQTVLDGLKLQECNPTFPSGRDAIIAADLAATGGENRCMIWESFAKRGVGLNASAGSKTNINDQTEDFTVPEECKGGIGVSETEFILYPNPAGNSYSINFPLNMLGKMKIETYDASGRLVAAQEKLVVNVKQDFSAQRLTNGVYFLKITGNGREKILKLVVAKK